MKRLIIIFVFLLTVMSMPVMAADLFGIGISARSLGMGRSYVGLTDAGECVFGNPAGLYGLRKFEMVSMYTELTGDVKYTLLGAAIPSEPGIWGFGYASNKISDIFATTLDAVTGRPVTLAPFSYGTDMFLVNYAGKINKDLNYGVRLKYLEKGGSIDTAGKGTGMNLDLGVLYSINEDAKVGAVMENMIAGGPGAIIWSNGLQEEMPFSLNAGGSYRLKKYNTTVYSDISLRKNMPSEIRIGTEWNAWKTLDLRAGLERMNQSATEQYTNYSFGIGYKFDNFRVDYAYYSDTLLPYNSRHYVSFSVSPPGILKEAAPVQKPVTPEAAKLQSGTIQLGYIGDLTIFDNNLGMIYMKYKYITRGEFVRAMESEFLKEKPSKKEKLAFSFIDIPLNYPPSPYIALAKKNEHVAGFPDGTFKPKKIMTRAEFIKIVVSMFENGDTEMDKRPNDLFFDIFAGHWAERYIVIATESRHVLGYPDGLFKPNRWVSKAEVITILRRMNLEGAAIRVRNASSAKIKAKIARAKMLKARMYKARLLKAKLLKEKALKAKQSKSKVKLIKKHEDPGVFKAPPER